MIAGPGHTLAAEADRFVVEVERILVAAVHSLEVVGGILEADTWFAAAGRIPEEHILVAAGHNLAVDRKRAHLLRQRELQALSSKRVRL